MALAATATRDLRRMISGQVLVPGDDQYDAARAGWNGMIDRFPAVITRCASSEDVAAAVRFGRAAELEIAVRGGGHSVSGQSSVDGGLVIDLSPMRQVSVDPASRRAIAAGGAHIGDLDAANAAHGLATTGGMVSNTGVGGLTLGGGYGWLARLHGLACDNLVSAEVVTADGSIVRATEDENADLFWGLRGGGGNFGVVTAFEYRLHPLPPAIWTADLFFDLDAGERVLEAFFELMDRAPDELYGMTFVTTGRSDHQLPEERLGRPLVGISWAYLGDAEEGLRITAAVRSVAVPIKEEARSVSYLEIQHGPDAGARPGRRWYWKSSFVSRLSEEAVGAFLSRGTTDGSIPRCGAEIISMGGAIARVGEDETAYGHRSARFDFLAVAAWEDPKEDEAQIADARRCWEAVSSLAGEDGVYVNNLGDEGADRVRAAYGEAKYARLVALKDRYDPDNVFHRNQNIRPSRG